MLFGHVTGICQVKKDCLHCIIPSCKMNLLFSFSFSSALCLLKLACTCTHSHTFLFSFMCVLPYLSFSLLVWFFCPFLALSFCSFGKICTMRVLSFIISFIIRVTVHLNSWSWSDMTCFWALVCHWHQLHLCCCMLNSDAFLYPIYVTCLHIVYTFSFKWNKTNLWLTRIYCTQKNWKNRRLLFL